MTKWSHATVQDQSEEEEQNQKTNYKTQNIAPARQRFIGVIVFEKTFFLDGIELLFPRLCKTLHRDIVRGDFPSSIGFKGAGKASR